MVDYRTISYTYDEEGRVSTQTVSPLQRSYIVKERSEFGTIDLIFEDDGQLTGQWVGFNLIANQPSETAQTRRLITGECPIQGRWVPCPQGVMFSLIMEIQLPREAENDFHDAIIILVSLTGYEEYPPDQETAANKLRTAMTIIRSHKEMVCELKSYGNVDWHAANNNGQ